MNDFHPFSMAMLGYWRLYPHYCYMILYNNIPVYRPDGSSSWFASGRYWETYDTYAEQVTHHRKTRNFPNIEDIEASAYFPISLSFIIFHDLSLSFMIFHYLSLSFIIGIVPNDGALQTPWWAPHLSNASWGLQWWTASSRSMRRRCTTTGDWSVMAGEPKAMGWPWKTTWKSYFFWRFLQQKNTRNR